MENNRQELEKSRDYIWNYFSLHASQRIAVFNFFVVMSGALTVGIAGALQGSRKLALVGTLLGPLLSLLSFVFWKLDQRVSFLIKYAERALSTVEETVAIAPACIFMAEPRNTENSILNAKKWSMQWSYGRSFRLIFVVMGILGITTTVVSVLKFSGKISW